MRTGSKLIVEIQADGSVKINASQMIGTEDELVKDLESLAKDLGGELKIEKHVHSHNHSHGHSHDHDHRNKQR